MKITIECASIEELIQTSQQILSLGSLTTSPALDIAPPQVETAEAGDSTVKKKTRKKKVSKKDAEGKPTQGRPSQAEIDAAEGEGAYDAKQDEKQLRDQAVNALQDLNVKKGIESCRYLLQKYGATRISEVKDTDLPNFIKNAVDQVAAVGA